MIKKYDNYINNENMSHFGTMEEKPNRFKDVRFISLLLRDTASGNLNWKNTIKDKDSICVFTATRSITERKKLVFSLKFSTSDRIEDNVLRVLLKMEKLENDLTVNSSSNIIKKLPLSNYPTLFALIKKVSLLYLGRPYVSTFANKDKTSNINPPQNLVVANDIEEYRKIILKEIQAIMKKLPDMANDQDWESKYMDVFTAYDNVKKSKTFDEINDLFYQASEAVRKNPPENSSKWARI